MMPRIRVKNALRTAAVPLLGVAILLAPAPDVLGDAAPATSSGILPLADYSGEYAKRSYLLGDFGGKRTEWAKQGFTFDIDYNQYFQAVTDGGRDRLPRLSSAKKSVKSNTDGSFNIYFGPAAPAGKESNWVQTVPGKGWNMLFRLYGPLQPYFDKTWRMGEIKLVQ
jgi:hypothetical protein